MYSVSDIKVSTLPSIYVDKTQIHQLFQNLIENGLKYNESEQASIEINSYKEEENFYFTIKNNGIGISEKFNQQIFEMFKRLHNRDTYQGTGIGLAICKKIIDTFEGEIWVDSVVGEGSTFHFTIPIIKPEISQEKNPKEEEKILESV